MCYEKCSLLSHETFLPDSLRLCGNSSFVNCLLKNHLKKTACKNHYNSCLYVHKQTSTIIGIDITVVVVLSVACFTVLVVVFVFFYRFFNRTSVIRNHKDELNLKQIQNHNCNDSFDKVWMSSQMNLDEGNHQKNTETEMKSVWSNIYITKLQDYETTDEEDENLHCSGEEDNSSMF